MQRRKFMIGVGSLAAGSAAAMGTGAFTSVTASRSVDVNVASDANAYLKLAGAGGANSDYVTSDGSSGTLSISLTDTATGGGQGVNPDAITEVDDLFVIANQGTQEVDVSITESGDNPGLVSFYATDQQGNADPYSNGDRLDGSGNQVTLGTGQSVYVSIEVDTTDSGLGDGDSLLDSVTVNATS